MKYTLKNKIEEKYRLVLELAPDGIVVIDKSKTIQLVNRQTEKLFGFSRDEMIGKELGMLIPDRFRKNHIEHKKQLIAEPKPRAMGVGKELFGKRKDGSEFPVEISLSPIQTDKDDAIILATIRDISEQNRISTELVEAKNKAEVATEVVEAVLKSKQQFLANMSHEIRTPMNAIVGFTKVLLKTVLSIKQKEYLDAIKTSGDALIVLINDILDLAKVDAGKMTFEQTPFKMKPSLTAVLHLFDIRMQEKELAFVDDYDNNIPEILIGDFVRLQQILLNLISNALKFTSKGKITVTTKLLNQNENEVLIQFSVTDTGIGIAEDKLQFIFENFQQASSSTSRIFGGTGLGLAIVKQLVEKQGGTINVKSKINEGSTFSFTLSFPKTNATIELESGTLELDKDIQNIKVLVVEDIKLNQLLMRTILDEFKFKHDIADNGKIALEKMQTETYDIILMDLQMPEMDGFEATAQIRNKLKSKIPIIALTADVTSVDNDKCKAVGMNDYISKPLDERILYTKIIELLKR
jgi:PAS domain S-box-containing protein